MRMFRYIYSGISIICISIFIPCRLVFAEDEIRINEFLVHPGGENKEWVELYIPEGKNCAGFWIDDDSDFESDLGNGKKFQIMDCNQPGETPYLIVENSSAFFNNEKDSVVLFDSNGMAVDQYEYDADPGIDVSLGRNPDTDGNFTVLVSRTKGSPNSMPVPTQTPVPTPTSKPTKEPTVDLTPTSKIGTAIHTYYTDQTDFVPTFVPVETGVSNQVSKIPIKKTIATNGAYPTVILRPENTIEPTRIPLMPTTIVMGESGVKIGYVYIILAGLSLVSCAILMVRKR